MEVLKPLPTYWTFLHLLIVNVLIEVCLPDLYEGESMENWIISWWLFKNSLSQAVHEILFLHQFGHKSSQLFGHGEDLGE